MTEIVRYPVRPLRPGDGRRLRERLALGLPGLTRAGSRFVFSRPAGSRLRRLVLADALAVGLAALSRGDGDVVEVIYAPQAEVLLADDIGPPDLPVRYGSDQMLEVLSFWSGPFSSSQWLAEEILDPGGARFAAKVVGLGTGQESGAAMRIELWGCYWTRSGRIERQMFFGSEADAVAAL